MSAADHPVTEAIAALLQGATDRHEERRLLELLAACEAAELDAFVAGSRLRDLISSVDDRLIGPDNRTALLELLTQRRIDDLGAAARAALVRALSRGATRSRDERAISAILLGTRGAALTALKDFIDGGADYHDLVHLVFHDIDDGETRSRIFDHLAAEGQSRCGVKVLSDIDDTFYANWKDKRYPSKTVYPGIRQLYAELTCSPPEPASAVVTFITARPEDPLGVVENATRRTLTERGLPRARVLSGAFNHLLTNDSIAQEKFHNFERYRKVFPEYAFVFFGDSGQGDVIFGQRMREAAPDVVPLVLIHDVVATQEERRAELRAAGVHLFDTYVGAALVAFEAGLISIEAVGRVAATARLELAGVAFAAEAERLAREAELARDIALYEAKTR